MDSIEMENVLKKIETQLGEMARAHVGIMATVLETLHLLRAGKPDEVISEMCEIRGLAFHSIGGFDKNTGREIK